MLAGTPSVGFGSGAQGRGWSAVSQGRASITARVTAGGWRWSLSRPPATGPPSHRCAAPGGSVGRDRHPSVM